MRPIFVKGRDNIWRSVTPRDVDWDQWAETIDRLMTILARNFAKTPPICRPPIGVLCHCGCLLTRADESCPACLVWAEKDARLHAERAQSFANRHVIWDILAARKEREEAA